MGEMVIRILGGSSSVGGEKLRWVESVDEGGANLCSSPLEARRFSRFEAGRILLRLRESGVRGMMEGLEYAKGEHRRKP